VNAQRGALVLALVISAGAVGCWSADPLPALAPITVDNAGRILLLRTLAIPEYARGALSQCSIAFSEDGRLLVAASGRNPVPVWDVQSGSVLRRLYEGSPQQIVACAFSPDGSMLACGGFDRAITLWDLATGEQRASWPAHASPVWELAFSPQGGMLASCSLSSDIGLWSPATGEAVWSRIGMRGYLSVAFDPAGTTLAYGGRWDGAGVLSTETGDAGAALSEPQSPVGDVAWSPIGDLLAAGTDDNVIYLWSTADWVLSASLEGHLGYVNGIAFSPDGVLLASGSHDKTVGIWDVAGRSRLATLGGHTSEVLRVAFSPDGTLIASTSWDGTVRLWGVPQE